MSWLQTRVVCGAVAILAASISEPRDSEFTNYVHFIEVANQ